MNLLEKTIEILEKLPPEKLKAAVKLLEILKGADNAKLEEIIYTAWEATLEEEELTPEEQTLLIQSEAEVKAGLGIKAEDVWRELGLSDGDPEPKD